MTKPTLSVNLAATLDKGAAVVFPKFASPKYDGIRCVIIDGAAYSRNMILIPNLTVQAYFADGLCDGFDGELISGRHDKDVFKRTSSVVRSINGSSEWHFKVFDIANANADANFSTRLMQMRERIADLQDLQKFKVSLVVQTMLLDDIELTEYEAKCLADGYEGAMLRNPTAKYKNGRATANSQDLLKVKQFSDSDAIVTGWTPMIEVRGTTRYDLMGSLAVRDIHTGIEFFVGSGFTAEERVMYASNPPMGQVFTYQFFAQGNYNKPRFPTFKGFRLDIPAGAAYLGPKCNGRGLTTGK